MLGPSPLRLGYLYQRSFRLSNVVVPVLRRLAEESGETSSFYVRQDDERVCLHRVESPRAVRHFVLEGDRRPLERGAAGKILLAFGDSDDAALDDIRRAMISVTLGENTPETAGIACPVFGMSQVLLGALSLSGPIQRFTPEMIPHAGSLLLSAARALTHDLGGDPSPFATAEQT